MKPTRMPTPVGAPSVLERTATTRRRVERRRRCPFARPAANYPPPDVVHERRPRRELKPGDTLGPYRLDELLGEGGMGLVFKATRESDGAVVALKVMRFELIEDPGLRPALRAGGARRGGGHRAAPRARARGRAGRRAALPRLEVHRRQDARRDARRRARSTSPRPRSTRSTSAAGLQALARGRASSTATSSPRTSSSTRPGGNAHRLRAREGARLHRAHQARPGDGNARLPRARAGQGRAGDARDRHLRARLHRLRVRRRPAAVRATRRASRSASRTSRSRRPRSRSSATTSRRSSRPPF